jgi:hypothetical protein
MAALAAWPRRVVVSFGIGTTSYIIMLAIFVSSVVFDQELAPWIKTAEDAGRGIIAKLDYLASGSHWGQVAVNHLRERVNMTHVVLSLPAIIVATLLVGIPLNKALGGTLTALQRLAVALVSIPSTVVLAVALFSFNALFPDVYASLLRFADGVWLSSLNALGAVGEVIPAARKLTNVARLGITGHHYVIMALCSMVASFLVNAAFALVTRRSTRGG